MRYAGRSAHELRLMGYGALSLWLIVQPERFGRAPLPDDEMISAADRASRALRKMFHGEPLKPWRARQEKSGVSIFSYSRRRVERGESYFRADHLTEF